MPTLQEKHIRLKQGNICHVLYVAKTKAYTSFTIEKGIYQGKVQANKNTCYHAVEHTDNRINYLQLEDIHKSKKDAYKALKRML